MIELQISCSMCGRILPKAIDASTVKQFEITGLSKELKLRDWILDVNGEFIDTYCSKKCAE